MGASGKQARARAAEWIGRKGWPHPRMHARTPARALTHSDPVGVLGNTTLVGELSAGLGGAVALLLVIGIVLILRRRRSARATDPAPGLRTPLVGE